MYDTRMCVCVYVWLSVSFLYKYNVQVPACQSVGLSVSLRGHGVVDRREGSAWMAVAVAVVVDDSEGERMEGWMYGWMHRCTLICACRISKVKVPVPLDNSKSNSSPHSVHWGVYFL